MANDPSLLDANICQETGKSVDRELNLQKPKPHPRRPKTNLNDLGKQSELIRPSPMDLHLRLLWHKDFPHGGNRIAKLDILLTPVMYIPLISQ